MTIPMQCLTDGGELGYCNSAWSLRMVLYEPVSQVVGSSSIKSLIRGYPC